ncbi:LacI family transcriptional regulator [Conyzicola lurida]|uniref:LacI family transcriptional regulator n=1 Tax=Conyzicola lurida TaxID=1172621 RepID=A0A841ASN7_9MICO|nr:LacI family DNA-binding transcriptional regulator [Conyzicola lurida]MBB5844811.1 LacI family transcriptional regulator [Conyzicola lurida]
MPTARRTATVTLHDVAREAGVSLATASRALNGSSRTVNDDYRQRVLAAALKLNYTTNLSAQAVAKGSTTSVALLVGDIADPYFSSIAAGVIKGSEDAGLIVTMSVTDRSPERELELVRALRGQRPRVIILAGSRSSDEEHQPDLVRELEAFEAGGGRVVFVSQHELPFDTVRIDNYGGARALAESLVELGYTRFAAITGEAALITATDRLAGFTDGLAAHGIEIPADKIVPGGFTRDGGFAGAVELADRGLDGVELVFAVNDVVAIGAMSGLRSRGIEPGRDVAVAGFDDIQTVRDVTPALTTVGIPLFEVGESALAVALRPREAGSERDLSVPTSVVLRASTPGVPAR